MIIIWQLVLGTFSITKRVSHKVEMTHLVYTINLPVRFIKLKSLHPKCLEVFLWIYGRDLVPNEITNSLKLEPTKTHSESNVKQWILNSCNLQPNSHLIKHMDSILDQIEVKQDELEEIRRQGNQTVLYCKIAVDDDQAVFAFDPSLTSRVAKLGLLFTLDVSYPVDQK